MELLAVRKRKAPGFTLIELLVVIAIISLLVSILLPSLNRARELAKTVVCSSNCRGIHLAFVFYTDANDGWLPHSYPQYPGDPYALPWFQRIDDEYMDGATDVFFCPSDGDADPNAAVSLRNISVGANESGPFPFLAGPSPWHNFNLTTIPGPGAKAMFCDGQARPGLDSWRFAVTGLWDIRYWPSDRHSGGSNVTFCDGHVERLGWYDLRVLQDWADFNESHDLWYISQAYAR